MTIKKERRKKIQNCLKKIIKINKFYYGKIFKLNRGGTF